MIPERGRSYPGLIREALSRRPPRRPEISPRKQAQADQICSQIYETLKPFLEQHGQPIFVRVEDEKDSNSEKMRKKASDLYPKEQVPGAYHISLRIPRDEEGVRVTLDSGLVDPQNPDSGEIQISVPEIASERGLLIVKKEGGTLWRQSIGRWGDTGEPLRRASLEDAKKFQGLVNFILQQEDLTPWRLA